MRKTRNTDPDVAFIAISTWKKGQPAEAVCPFSGIPGRNCYLGVFILRGALQKA